MIKSDPLNEHEFELINIVGATLALNQRDLSRQMNLSLGMTNMLLRRLVTKGYIRIAQLNKRKMQYILTSKGFAEKMRKSVTYTLKTIRSIGLIRENLARIVNSLYIAGERSFYILGESDLAILIEMVIHAQHKDVVIKNINVFDESLLEGVVLICTEKISLPLKSQVRSISIIEELAKDSKLFT